MPGKSAVLDESWWAAVAGEGAGRSPGLPAGLSLRSAVEALLLASSEPLRSGDAAAVLSVEESAVTGTLRSLAEEYRRDRRGFQVVEVAGGFRLVTLPELAAVVLAMRPEITPIRLSGAARETLAVLAYRREATRAEVERVRGVNCEKLLAALLEHGLIEERGRRDVPGRPIVYAPAARFLEHFGLASLDDLPPLSPSVNETSGVRED